MSQVRTIKRDKDGNDLPPPTPIYQAAKKAFPDWYWTQREDGTVSVSVGVGGDVVLRESGAGVEAEVLVGLGREKEKVQRSWGICAADAVRAVFGSILLDAAQARGIGFAARPKPRPRWPSGPTVPE